MDSIITEPPTREGIRTLIKEIKGNNVFLINALMIYLFETPLDFMALM